MDYDAFSQTAYGDEAALRIHRYEEMFAEGNALYENLPKEEKDAFFQLVLMRIHAAYFTNLAYYYGDRSTLMHEQGSGGCAQTASALLQSCDVQRKMERHSEPGGLPAAACGDDAGLYTAFENRWKAVHARRCVE